MRPAFDLLLLAWVGSEAVIFFTTVGRIVASGERHRRDRGSGIAVVAGVALGLGLATRIAIWAPWAGMGDLRAPLFWTGIGLGLAGIGLRGYAVLTLGRFFRMAVEILPGQTVVEGGPYRWVRHPSYSGALLTILGVMLCLGNWLSLLGLAVAAAGIAYRIAVEESALRAGLGEPYVAYARAHRRLIPGLL